MIPNLPANNYEVTKMLYFLETGLREFIVEVMNEKYGFKWFKMALPGGGGKDSVSILEKYKRSKENEKLTPWASYIPHHPIYYLDFPDLATIIEKNDNWENVFHFYFKRKDIIVSNLRSIEPIRNKVAHNRKAANSDVLLTSSVVQIFIECIGSEKMYELSNRCTSATDIPIQFIKLREEGTTNLSKCLTYQPLNELVTWKNISKQWWFDSDYLTIDVSIIQVFFEELITYSEIPRLRGSGDQIEKWVKQSRIEEKFNSIKPIFDSITKDFSYE